MRSRYPNAAALPYIAELRQPRRTAVTYRYRAGPPASARATRLDELVVTGHTESRFPLLGRARSEMNGGTPGARARPPLHGPF